MELYFNKIYKYIANNEYNKLHLVGQINNIILEKIKKNMYGGGIEDILRRKTLISNKVIDEINKFIKKYTEQNKICNEYLKSFKKIVEQLMEIIKNKKKEIADDIGLAEYEQLYDNLTNQIKTLNDIINNKNK
jgi:hypothetical protein